MPQEYINDIAQFNPMLNPALRQGYNNYPTPPIQTVPQAIGPNAPQNAQGLLPMLLQKAMGQAPSQLLQKQQQFQMEMQKEMEAHQMTVLKSSYDLYNKLLSSQHVRDLAKAAGVTEEQFVNQISPEVTRNAVTYEQIKGNAMKTPEFQQSVEKGMNASAQMPDTMARKELTTQTPQNTITTVPNAGSGNAGNTVVQGPLQAQGLAQGIGGMLYPYTKTTPGSVNQQIPVDPLKAQQALDAMRGTLGGGLPSSYHNFVGGAFDNPNGQSSTPQPNNATPQVQTTPPPNSGQASALTPQWPPRSGLIPGGYDVLGAGANTLFNMYKSGISDPVYRMLMGQ